MADNIPAVTPTAKQFDEKAYSERLNKDRAKIKEEIAKELLGVSYEEARQRAMDQKIIDAGLSPDDVKPILDELKKLDPSFVAAEETAKKSQDLLKQQQLTAEIEQVNKDFGTAFTDIESIPAEVQALVEKGLTLKQAYLAVNGETLVKNKPSGSDILRNSLQHMKPPIGNGGNIQVDDVDISAEQFAMMKRFNPTLTDEQIRDFINKNSKK